MPCILPRLGFITILTLLSGLAGAQELMAASTSGWTQFSARPETTYWSTSDSVSVK